METAFTATDKINILLLLATSVGALGVYWQVRVAAKSQKAMFLKDLYMKLRNDKDISDAYYLIEYGKFEYSSSFHGSKIEPKIDRLLTLFDIVCELYFQGTISKREMIFFEYQFLRVYNNTEIQKYLQFLICFYASVGANKLPFSSFQSYASKMRKV
jgi:hypothetical protein